MNTMINEADIETGQRTSRPPGSARCPSPSLLELLKAYQRVQDAADDLPPLVMVRARHQASEVLSRFRSLPRPRWFLRFFVAYHVDQVLAALNRRYNARAALNQASEFDEHDHRAVEEFRRSLSPTRVKTYMVALFLFTLALSQPVVIWLVGIAMTVVGENDAYSGPTGKFQLLNPDQIKELMNKIGGVVSPTPNSVGDALSALEAAGIKSALIVAVGCALTLYALLRLLTPAFRLKRMLFNLYPSVEHYKASTTARWHVSHSTGVYELEAAHFRALGITPKSEFPVDLAALGLVVLFPLFLGVLVLGRSLLEPDLVTRLFEGVFGLLLLATVLLRFGWLLRTWHRRSSSGRVPYAPFEVLLDDHGAIAQVQSPSSVGTLSFASLFLLLYYPLAVVPWWYRINRELRDLGRARGVESLGRSPALSAVAFLGATLYGLPALITVYRTCRRIRTAQQLVGVADRLKPPWALMLGILFCPPLLFAYLQGALNKVWLAAGEPLTDAPHQRLLGVDGRSAATPPIRAQA
jgi:hypothetical protein